MSTERKSRRSSIFDTLTGKFKSRSRSNSGSDTERSAGPPSRKRAAALFDDEPPVAGPSAAPVPATTYADAPAVPPPRDTVAEAIRRIVRDETSAERARKVAAALPAAPATPRPNLLVAIPPQLPADLDLQQEVLTLYIRHHLNVNTTVYNFMRTVGGDRAVGYMVFVLYLQHRGVDDALVRDTARVMRVFYDKWADTVHNMVPLAVNLNGHDPIKEIMTLVNQSVYTVVRFVLSTQELSSPDYFTGIDLGDRRQAEVPAWIKDEHLALRDVFNARFYAAFAAPSHKQHHNEQATPHFDLGMYKLLRPPLSLTKVQTFVVDKRVTAGD